MNHQHDPDLRDCIDCGREYDLARQDYYGPRCPQCNEDPAPEAPYNFIDAKPKVVEKFTRTCADCGDSIVVTLYDDDSYEGGHYWDLGFDMWEYWECDECYRKAEEIHDDIFADIEQEREESRSLLQRILEWFR